MPPNTDLDERIAREFTKHGWKQVKIGNGVLYERPLNKVVYERMVNPKKVTIVKRKTPLQAVKHLLSRWFI